LVSYRNDSAHDAYFCTAETQKAATINLMNTTHTHTQPTLAGAINALIHFYLRFAAKVIFSGRAQSGHWGFARQKRATQYPFAGKTGLKST
jgi:hypothetical protein